MPQLDPLMSRTVLVADIGGTTTRIGRAGADGVPFDIRIETNASYGGLEELLRSYLAATGGAAPQMAVLAIAAPVDGDMVRMTNGKWSFSIAALAAAFGFRALRVLNDFAALAHGVPRLGRADLVEVGAGRAVKDAAVLVCGPGTGFGSAVLLPREGGHEVRPSEAGHMRLGAVTTAEARVVAHMVRDFGAVSVERVLSGAGLVRLHAILTGEEVSSHALIRAAITGQRQERESCMVFLRLLGRVVGDLALAFDARGGVYLAGGVAHGLSELFADSPFRAEFENHPPYNDRLALIPVHVVTHATPGLVGAGEVGRALLAQEPPQNR